MKDWYVQAKSYPIEAIAEGLGLKKKGNRWGPCPTCGAENLKEISKTQKNRYPLRLYTCGDNTEMWECMACNEYGNSFDMVAWAKEGRSAADTLTSYYDKQAKKYRNDWTVLRTHFQEMHICEHTVEKLRQHTRVKYPPTAEVELLLKTSTWIPRCDSQRIISWCNRRKLDKEKMQAGVVNPGFDCSSLTTSEWHDKTLPWWLDKWITLYPILIPLVDCSGNLKSVVGRATNSGTRKTTCPLGFSTANLFFANKNARRFLKREYIPEKIWICEGEVDYLTIAQLDQMTVIGVRSGSMSHLANMPWQICQTVFIATDNDATGEKYADEIAKNLFPASGRRIDVRNLGGMT